RRRRLYRSIEPDTSHITTSLVLFCLRCLKESSMISPPVFRDCLSVLRKWTLGPRLTDLQRRLGLRASLLAILRDNRRTSANSSAEKWLKSFTVEDAASLATGTSIDSEPACSAGSQFSSR